MTRRDVFGGLFAVVAAAIYAQDKSAVTALLALLIIVTVYGWDS